MVYFIKRKFHSWFGTLDHNQLNILGEFVSHQWSVFTQQRLSNSIVTTVQVLSTSIRTILSYAAVKQDI